MLHSRVLKAGGLLAELGLDALIFTGLPNIRYLAGFTGSDGVLVVARDGAWFLTDSRYTTQAGQEASHCRVREYRVKVEGVAALCVEASLVRVGIEAEQTTVAFHRALAAALAGVELVPLEAELNGLRLVKEPAELELLSTCAAIASAALEEILPQNAVFQDFEVDRNLPGLGHRVLILNARRLRQNHGSDLILLALQDVTLQKQMEAELKESESKLQVLNVELMNSQESERHSVSLALHEELAQNLVALKLKLRNIESHLPENQAEAKEDLDQVMKSLDGLVEEARELSGGLRPQVLDLGLTPALRHLVEHFTQYFQMDAAFEVSDLDTLLASQTQVMIYRVLQEAMVNVVKHAQATRVSLEVGKQDGKLRFQVADNGIGFQVDAAAGVEFCQRIQASPDKAWLVGGMPFVVTKDGKEFQAVPEVLGADTGRKMGLALMEGRIRSLGGNFTISSEKDKGTKITFTVPTDGNEVA